MVNLSNTRCGQCDICQRQTVASRERQWLPMLGQIGLQAAMDVLPTPAFPGRGIPLEYSLVLRAKWRPQ